jgi:pimeloyl-[acyl-carrier protein] methyl ester esterase
MALHVERLGSGPDLVFLHGWGLHGGAWASLAEKLAGSFRLHLVDLPGHGRSRDQSFGSIDQVADCVAARVPEGAGLCGWSLGGLVALRIATRHPARLAALALVGTTPCFVQRDGWGPAMDRETLDAFGEELRADPVKAIRSFVHLNALGGPHERDRVRELAAIVAARVLPSVQSLAAGLALLRDADLRSDAAAIGCPAVVIHGSRDALAPIGAGRWLASAIPGARLLEIAGASHTPFLSHADAVAHALESLHG